MFPAMMFWPSNTNHQMNEIKILAYTKQYLWQVDGADMNVSDKRILKWIQKYRNDQIKIVGRKLKLNIKLLVLGSAVFVFVLIYIYARSIVMNQKLWLAGSLIVYFYSISGSAWVLDASPPWRSLKNSLTPYILTGSVQQFGVEGVLISFIMLLIILCFVLFTSLKEF